MPLALPQKRIQGGGRRISILIRQPRVPMGIPDSRLLKGVLAAAEVDDLANGKRLLASVVLILTSYQGTYYEAFTPPQKDCTTPM